MVTRALEWPGLTVRTEGVTGAFTRVAIDLRGAVKVGDAVVRARAFAGGLLTPAPREAQFGFRSPVLLRGVAPPTPTTSVLVGNLELGWQPSVGFAVSNLVLVRPGLWGFLDAGYAPRPLADRSLLGRTRRWSLRGASRIPALHYRNGCWLRRADRGGDAGGPHPPVAGPLPLDPRRIPMTLRIYLRARGACLQGPTSHAESYQVLSAAQVPSYPLVHDAARSKMPADWSGRSRENDFSLNS